MIPSSWFWAAISFILVVVGTNLALWWKSQISDYRYLYEDFKIRFDAHERIKRSLNFFRRQIAGTLVFLASCFILVTGYSSNTMTPVNTSFHGNSGSYNLTSSTYENTSYQKASQAVPSIEEHADIRCEKSDDGVVPLSEPYEAEPRDDSMREFRKYIMNRHKEESHEK